MAGKSPLEVCVQKLIPENWTYEKSRELNHVYLSPSGRLRHVDVPNRWVRLGLTIVSPAWVGPGALGCYTVDKIRHLGYIGEISRAMDEFKRQPIQLRLSGQGPCAQSRSPSSWTTDRGFAPQPVRLFDPLSQARLSSYDRMASWNDFGGGALPNTFGSGGPLQIRLNFDPTPRWQPGFGSGFGSSLGFSGGGSLRRLWDTSSGLGPSSSTFGSSSGFQPVRLFDPDSRRRMGLGGLGDSFGASLRLGSSGSNWGGGSLRSLWDASSGAGSSFSSMRLASNAFGAGTGGFQLSTSPSLAGAFNPFPSPGLGNISLSNPFSGGAGGGFLSGLARGLG